MADSTTLPSSSGSQTLSRGIRLLEILSSTDRALSIADLARELGVHRSVAYRLLRTLEDHNLITRDKAGLIELGAGLAALSSGVARDLQQLAQPVLNDIANELGMTCLLAVMIDSGEAVTLLSAAPRKTVAVVSYRPGHRHPLGRGAPGKAILLALPESSWPSDLSDEVRDEVRQSRARGYASSHDEVVTSLTSVAVPLQLPGQQPAALGVVHVSLTHPEHELAERLTLGAQSITRSYGA